jgi:hypothetical protein
MPKASVSALNPRAARPTMTSPTGVQYEVANVTPAQARLWLGQNTDNRRLRQAAAGRYARDMKAGTWAENGSAVVFAADGTLLDGQHRLEGCVGAGVPFTTLIIRNVERSTQNTIDDGAKRTLSDRFTFSGHTNSSTAAAVVRRILLWDAGFKTNTGQYQPSTREALDIIDRDPTVVAAVEMAVAMRGSKLLPPSIIGLAWWLFWGIDSDDCQEFWDGMHTGAGLDTESPILVLRNQIIRKTGEPGRIPETVILAWVIKAWNDWRDSKVRVRPYYLRPGERFPEPK